MATSARKIGTMLDVFCGVGGLSLGFEAAGLEPALAIDLGERQARIYAKNRPACPVLVGDCRRFRPSDIRSAFGKGVDVVIGGVPSEPFSTARGSLSSALFGSQAGDGRRTLISQALQLVDVFKPRAFAFENVWRAADSTEWKRAAQLAKRKGWSVAIWKLNAADYGVPQMRRRAFLVGVRGTSLPDPPAKLPAMTAKAALLGLGDPRVGGADSLHVPFPPPPQSVIRRAQGLSARRMTLTQGDGYPDRTHWIAREDRATPAHVSSGRPLHWTMRYLTAREIARLQQFPDSYELDVSPSQARRLLGDAVPVGLGEAVAKALLGTVRKSLSCPAQPIADLLSPLLDSSENRVDDAVAVALAKAETKAERFVLGVVAQPGDGMTAEQVRSAAHRFLADVRKLRADGKAVRSGAVRVLESGLLPGNAKIGSSEVLAGSWVLGLRIVDDALWDGISSGKITGFDLGQSDAES